MGRWLLEAALLVFGSGREGGCAVVEACGWSTRVRVRRERGPCRGLIAGDSVFTLYFNYRLFRDVGMPNGSANK